MNTGLNIAPVKIPTPKQFGEAWGAFFATVSAIAQYRANGKGAEKRFGELAIHAADLLEQAKDDAAFMAMVSEMIGHQYEKISLGILYEELLYISYKYKAAFQAAEMMEPEVIRLLEQSHYFNSQPGELDGSDAIDDIEVVKGSIQNILDKLPGWLRNLIEAIMEALKLTRGSVD